MNQNLAARWMRLNYREYGKGNKDVIILLHGGGLSWWNYREAAEMLQSHYHVILPILDGHAGCNRDFTSIEDNADEIIRFVDERFGGSVLLMGGLSLGGQVLLEILFRRKDICRYAFVESALVVPSRLTYALVKPAFGSCHGLIRYEWFSRIQFKALRLKPDLFEDYYRDTCRLSKRNMIAFLQANSLFKLKGCAGDFDAQVHIFVGEKENAAMRKSAVIIHESIRGSSLYVLPRMYHGEFSINHADDYVNKILEVFNGR